MFNTELNIINVQPKLNIINVQLRIKYVLMFN